MKTKIFENARFTPKGDIEANWNKAVGFIPLDKEIIIYKPDENYSYARIKIGDGVTPVQDLPFIDKHLVNKDELQNEINSLPQADYEQYDEAATDYIKNRPFYDNYKLIREEQIIYPGSHPPQLAYNETGNYTDSEIEALWFISSDLEKIPDEAVIHIVSYSLHENQLDLIPNAYTITAKDRPNIFKQLRYQYWEIASEGNGKLITVNLGWYVYSDSYAIPGAEIVTKVVVPEIIEGEFKQLDEKFIPDTIARTEKVNEKINEAITSTEKYVDEKISKIEIPDVQIQPDWNQNDVAAADYIKNRPFYSTIEEGEEILADTNSIVSSVGTNYIDATIDGTKYSVEDIFNLNINGKTYSNIPFRLEDIGEYSYYGNLWLINNELENTGEDYIVVVAPAENWIVIMTNEGYNIENFTFTRVAEVENIKKLDAKYLPNGLATQEYVDEKFDGIEIPTNYITINTDQTNLSGTKTWTANGLVFNPGSNFKYSKAYKINNSQWSSLKDIAEFNWINNSLKFTTLPPGYEDLPSDSLGSHELKKACYSKDGFQIERLIWNEKDGIEATEKGLHIFHYGSGMALPYHTYYKYNSIVHSEADIVNTGSLPEITLTFPTESGIIATQEWISNQNELILGKDTITEDENFYTLGTYTNTGITLEDNKFGGAVRTTTTYGRDYISFSHSNNTGDNETYGEPKSCNLTFPNGNGTIATQEFINNLPNNLTLTYSDKNKWCTWIGAVYEGEKISGTSIGYRRRVFSNGISFDSTTLNNGVWDFLNHTGVRLDTTGLYVGSYGSDKAVWDETRYLHNKIISNSGNPVEEISNYEYLLPRASGRLATEEQFIGLPQEPGWKITRYILNHSFKIYNNVDFYHEGFANFIEYESLADSTKHKIVADIHITSEETISEPSDIGIKIITNTQVGNKWESAPLYVNNVFPEGFLDNTKYTNITVDKYQWITDITQDAVGRFNSDGSIGPVLYADRSNGFVPLVWGNGLELDTYNDGQPLIIGGKEIKVTYYDYHGIVNNKKS